MGPLSHYFMLRFFTLLIFVSYLAQSSSTHGRCHVGERAALLQFKESFIINKSVSRDPSAYPKVMSWKLQGLSGDCCYWDGIACDEDTGYVISLNLTSSCLYGSIDSTSTLFQLVHLKWLSLADNDFNYSQIPSGLGHLQGITHLDLSFSNFSGQIPSEIFELSKLEFLDLTHNELKLQTPGLSSVAEKLTNLKQLHLTGVNISSTVPRSLANLSSLTSLFLRECELHGDFPTEIFHLPNLQSLSVRFNPNLTGQLPEFDRSSVLQDLLVAGTSSQADLFLSLLLPGWIPSSIGNLSNLKYFDLSPNNFSGQIPSSLGNLTLLRVLLLEENALHGPIPRSTFGLANLQALDVRDNLLSGTLKLDLFLTLKDLTFLQLSYNNLSLLVNRSNNFTLSKLQLLGLGSCNLREFPYFLQTQDELEFLELSGNNIHGQIPKWMLTVGKETLWYLGLSSNFLAGFDQPPSVLPWSNLRLLDLSLNKLHGSLPIPPPSIFIYIISDNSLTGPLSPAICNLTSLSLLDLSKNNLSGTVPQCLSNLSKTLSILNLRNNHFHSTIPQNFPKGCDLRMIDFSHNQMQGRLPKSLANCLELGILNVGHNQINDNFPSWLGNLPELRVLMLQSNRFHGEIGKPKVKFEFPKLHIIGLSNNSFSGKLPTEHIQNWKAMKFVDAEELRYLQANTSFEMPNSSLAHNYNLSMEINSEGLEMVNKRIQGFLVPVALRYLQAANTGFEIPKYSMIQNYAFSMSINNKGLEMEYKRIQEFLVAVDLSSNRFEGEIPEVLGDLKSLKLLNLSRNILTGCIPSSLGNLTELESLDLSLNNLSCEIPQQLAQLTFLAFLNVSHNQLVGPTPIGKQFDTFQSNSFAGNPGLCGKQLSKECGSPMAKPPAPSTFEEDEDRSSWFEFDWKIVVTGYASGLVIGVSIGYMVTLGNKNGS